MRPLGPLPLSRDRSTPSSRAHLRTEGDACAALNACGSTGASGGATGASDAGARAGVGAAGAGAGMALLSFPLAGEGWGGGEVFAPLAATVAITVPSLTRSPTETRTPWIAPATGDGTSIVALSDSSVTSG